MSFRERSLSSLRVKDKEKKIEPKYTEEQEEWRLTPFMVAHERMTQAIIDKQLDRLRSGKVVEIG